MSEHQYAKIINAEFGFIIAIPLHKKGETFHVHVNGNVYRGPEKNEYVILSQSLVLVSRDYLCKAEPEHLQIMKYVTNLENGKYLVRLNQMYASPEEIQNPPSEIEFYDSYPPKYFGAPVLYKNYIISVPLNLKEWRKTYIFATMQRRVGFAMICHRPWLPDELIKYIGALLWQAITEDVSCFVEDGVSEIARVKFGAL